jgi:hypothetical protein
MGEVAVALFLGFFALLAGGALAAQIYGLTGAAERRSPRSSPRTDRRTEPPRE